MKSDTRNFGKITMDSGVQNALWFNGTKENETDFNFRCTRQVTLLEVSTNIGTLFYLTNVCSCFSSAPLTYVTHPNLARAMKKAF